MADCEILDLTPKAVLLHPIRFDSRDPESPAITLAEGLLSKTRFETLVEQISQFPVSAILPFISDYCQQKKEVYEAALPRLNKKTAVAIKQSKRFFQTKLLPAIPFEKVLEAGSGFDLVLFFTNRDHSAKKPLDLNEAKSILIIVGPEGGFSPREEEQANDSGVNFLGLGPSRLRSETAGVAAVSAVLAKSGKML